MAAAFGIEFAVERVEHRQIPRIGQTVDDTSKCNQFKDAAKDEKWQGKNFKI